MPDGHYMKFIRTVLNEDEGENGRVPEAETVRAMGQNGLGGKTIKMLPGAIPTLSNDAELVPGMPKGWSYTFTVNHEDAPTGCPIGELGWAGLANLFHRIGRTNGIGGIWATRILPFAGPISLGGYMEFETAVYSALRSGAPATSGRIPEAG
jgi:methyl acetate hydrolase